MKGLFCVIEMLYVLIMTCQIFTWGYMLVKIYLTVHLRWIHFIISLTILEKFKSPLKLLVVKQDTLQENMYIDTTTWENNLEIFKKIDNVGTSLAF